MSELEATEQRRWQGFYTDRSRPVPFFGSAHDETLHDRMQRGLNRPGDAPDIGCGNGRNATHLARQPACGKVQAIDYSASAAQVCLHQGSVFEFALPPASLDLTYDPGCFHHMAPPLRDRFVRLVADA